MKKKLKEKNKNILLLKLNKLKKIKLDDFEKHTDIYNDIIKHCPSMSDTKLKFVSEYGSKIKYEAIHKANKSINRSKAVISLSNRINDIDIAIGIEAGIFEFALVYILINNLSEGLLTAVYNDKYNDIHRIFDKKSSIYNRDLLINLLNNKHCPQKVAFMSPQEINPKKWEKLIKKKNLIEYKKNNMGATDLYKCYKCGKRRTSVMQAQLRGADEQMNCLIRCLVCGNQWQS
jgi:DNA-directed RNA polymerase subunit M/transcription elongation factor TFIIS